MYLLLRVVHFGLEILVRVVDEAKVFVTHVRGLNALVPLNGFLGALMTCFVVLTAVGLGSAISCCNHMNDCFISAVTKLNCAPRSFV